MSLGRLRAFGAFWYDFVVGDDWRVAVGVTLGLLGTFVAAHAGHRGAWWILLTATVGLLPVSIWRVTRRN